MILQYFKFHHTALSLSFSLATAAALAAEPLSDEQMSALVVEDPFGATAAGVSVNTGMESTEKMAYSNDQQNQLNDPNNKSAPSEQASYHLTLGESGPEHSTQILDNGLKIQSQGSVQHIHVDHAIDGPGANRGAQTFQNLQIQNTAVIRAFK